MDRDKYIVRLAYQRMQIIPEEEGKKMMREFHKDIKVRFYKDFAGWNYEVTGFQPPHERAEWYGPIEPPQ